MGKAENGDGLGEKAENGDAVENENGEGLDTSLGSL